MTKKKKPDAIAPLGPADLEGLHSLSPRARMEALLERPDARKAVRSVEPVALYHLVREVGLEDAVELVMAASPRQVQAFIDLDCWRKDAFQGPPLVEWLEVLFQSSDKRFTRLMDKLDFEPLALLLRDHAQVFTVDEDGELPEELVVMDSSHETYDGVYLIVYDDDEDTTRALRQLLIKLYEVNMKLAWMLLETVRWELRAPLEERAWQDRVRRLERVGFIEVSEAMAIYATREPASLRRHLHEPAAAAAAAAVPFGGLMLLPDAVRDPLERDTLLARALALLKAQAAGEPGGATPAGGASGEVVAEGPVVDLGGLSFAFVTLINKAISTEGVELRDMEATRTIIERVFGAINIALEFIAERQLGPAARLLASAHPQELFQAGYTLTVRLAQQARRLSDKEGQAPMLSLTGELAHSLLSHGERSLIEGLGKPRPLYHDPSRDYLVPFESLDQVERAASRLARLAFKVTALFGLAGVDRGELARMAFEEGTLPPVESITLATCLRTFVALRALGAPERLRPLSVEELAALIEGPLRASTASGVDLSQDPLTRGALAALSHEAIEEEGRALIKTLTRELAASLIDAFAAISPRALREGSIPPEILGDTLLLRARPTAP